MEEGFKTNLKEIGHEDVDCILLGQIGLSG
jgi:hypothetical protein